MVSQRKVGNPCSINFGRMHGLLSCEVCFFRVLRHKADSSLCAPDDNFMQGRVCDCRYRKRDKQSVHVNSFLQVSCSSKESVVQQERSNCIVSSIRLSVRFDWRSFALALAARISIAELPVTLSAWLRVVAVHCLMSTTAKCYYSETWP